MKESTKFTRVLQPYYIKGKNFQKAIDEPKSYLRKIKKKRSTI